MTRKLYTTVILGITALALGVQSGLAGNPDVTSMIQAREKALGRSFQLGDFAVNNTWTGARVASRTPESQYLAAERARSEGLNRMYGLGSYASALDIRERALVEKGTNRSASPAPAPGYDARSDGLNRMYGLGKYAPPVVADDRFQIDRSDVPVSTSVSSSGQEIEWPQVGVGFGVGLVLILGLGLVLRATHTRPFAH